MVGGVDPDMGRDVSGKLHAGARAVITGRAAAAVLNNGARSERGIKSGARAVITGRAAAVVLNDGARSECGIKSGARVVITGVPPRWF